MIDPQKLHPVTYQALVAAGWFPNRQIPIDQWRDALIEEGYTWSDSAETFLAELGGLTIRPTRTSETLFGTEAFTIDPMLSLEEHERIHKRELYLGESMCLVGDYGGEGVLLIAPSGRVFIETPGRVLLFGATPTEALETIIRAHRYPKRVEGLRVWWERESNPAFSDVHRLPNADKPFLNVQMLHPLTRQALVVAGWFPHRCVSTDQWRKPLTETGYPWSDTIEAFLSNLGGLTIYPIENSEKIFGSKELTLEPRLSYREFSRIQHRSIQLKESLCLVGDWNPESLLLLTPSGRVYDENPLRICLVGETPLEALEIIVRAYRLPIRIAGHHNSA